MMRENTASIQFVEYPKFHRKTKHIKRRYHFVRIVIKEKEVIIKCTSTGRMIADPLTKSIPRDAFKVHVMSLGLCRT